MNHTEIYKKFNEVNVRVEKMFHLGSMCIHEDIPESLKLSCKDYMADVIEATDIKVKGEHYDHETLLNLLIEAERFGFLLHIATPIPDFSKDTDTPFPSWNHYSTKWIYSESFEEAAELAIKWAKDSYAESLAKHNAMGKLGDTI